MLEEEEEEEQQEDEEKEDDNLLNSVITRTSTEIRGKRRRFIK